MLVLNEYFVLVGAYVPEIFVLDYLKFQYSLLQKYFDDLYDESNKRNKNYDKYYK